MSSSHEDYFQVAQISTDSPSSSLYAITLMVQPSLNYTDMHILFYSPLTEQKALLRISDHSGFKQIFHMPEYNCQDKTCMLIPILIGAIGLLLTSAYICISVLRAQCKIRGKILCSL